MWRHWPTSSGVWPLAPFTPLHYISSLDFGDDLRNERGLGRGAEGHGEAGARGGGGAELLISFIAQRRIMGLLGLDMLVTTLLYIRFSFLLMALMELISAFLLIPLSVKKLWRKSSSASYDQLHEG